MKREMTPGALTIRKHSRGDECDFVEIVIREVATGRKLTGAQVSLEHFASAIMGLAEVPVQLDLRQDERVGGKPGAQDA